MQSRWATNARASAMPALGVLLLTIGFGVASFGIIPSLASSAPSGSASFPSSVPSHAVTLVVWGPPALHYSVFGIVPSSPPAGQSTGGAAASASNPTPSLTGPASDPGSGQGGWSPMMHWSKMPRLMALKATA